MKLNLLDPECPDFAGGFKFVAAVIVIGLIVAASESPINWLPTTTVHDVAASEAAPAPADYFPSDYQLSSGEPTPHVEAF